MYTAAQQQLAYTTHDYYYNYKSIEWEYFRASYSFTNSCIDSTPMTADDTIRFLRFARHRNGTTINAWL